MSHPGAAPRARPADAAAPPCVDRVTRRLHCVRWVGLLHEPPKAKAHPGGGSVLRFRAQVPPARCLPMPRSCWCPYGTPGLASTPGKEHVAPPPAAGDPRAKLAPTPWAVLGPATRPAARRAGKCLACVLDGGDSGVRRRPQSVTFVLTRHPRHLEPTASDTRLRAVVRAGARPVVCPVGPGGAAPLLPSLQQGAPRGDPARSPRAKGLVTAARGGHRQASRGEKRGPLRLGGVTGGEPAEAAGGSWPPGPRPLPCHIEATRGQRGQPRADRLRPFLLAPPQRDETDNPEAHKWA